MLFMLYLDEVPCCKMAIAASTVEAAYEVLDDLLRTLRGLSLEELRQRHEIELAPVSPEARNALCSNDDNYACTFDVGTIH